MTRLRTFALAAALAVHSTSLSWAFTGTDGANFLELPVGARPAAMGSAYSSLAEDAYAATWNPAGLAYLPSIEAAAMHMLYLESTSYEYASLGIPLGTGRGLGLAIRFFNPGTTDAYNLAGNRVGDFSGYYAAYSLAYGQAVSDSWSIGGAGHFIQAKIDDVSGHALAANAGVLFRPDARWRVAGGIWNLGQRLSLLSQKDRLPLSYRLGAAFHPTRLWTVSVEGAHRQTGLNSAHLGVEYEAPMGFSVRTGYNTERIRQLSAIAGFSFGVNLLIWRQDLSYTWLPLSDLGSSHLLSLVWHFGKGADSDANRLQRPPAQDELDKEWGLE